MPNHDNHRTYKAENDSEKRQCREIKWKKMARKETNVVLHLLCKVVIVLVHVVNCPIWRCGSRRFDLSRVICLWRREAGESVEWHC